VVQGSKRHPSLAATAIVVVTIVGLYLIAAYVDLLFHGMPYDPNATTYVTIDPEDTDRFLNDLGSIAESQGLEPWRGSAARGDGRTLYVLEATGRAMNIWAQNVPLSGQECAAFPGMGPDPGQFVIHALPAVWLPLRDRVVVLFGAISSGLSSKGYQLSAKPSVPCDPARLKSRAPPAA
jgi:hypothetical protein